MIGNGEKEGEEEGKKRGMKEKKRRNEKGGLQLLSEMSSREMIFRNEMMPEL